MSSLSTMTLQELLSMKSQYDAELASRETGASASASKPKTKSDKPKTKGPGTSWADYTKKVCTENAEAYKAFKEAAVSKLGVAPIFAKTFRDQHPETWPAFQAEWAAAHPKDSVQPKDSKGSKSEVKSEASAEESDAASNSGSEPAKKRAGRKKLTDMTAEELAAHKAKVAERSAKKKAAAAAEAAPALAEAKATAPVAITIAPVAASVPLLPASAIDDEEATELMPFVLDGHTYLRPKSGSEWASGDLWNTKADGSRGDYHGELMEDGSVDQDAQEPDLE